MSTATMDGRLYAVPDPTTKERLGILLRLRRGARRALDTALALPRAAAGWVLRHARTVLSAFANNPTLARLSARLRGLGSLIRTAGPGTVTAAVLSVPAVWRAATRAVCWIGAKLTAGASALWQWTRGTLARFGPTGVRIANSLGEAGSAVGGFVTRVATHPISQALARTVRSVARLVRPVSQSLVVHRLAAVFVAAPWLRGLLEVLVLPFVIAPGLTAHVGRHLRSVPENPSGSAPNAAATSSGTPRAASTTAAEAVPTEADAWDELLTPRNRAERRAQQQAQAHAKRTRARH
ncbi:hypothetical protein OO014_04230 [Intrasporangium calvum]|uniref:Integral membrane protein n=1 Tax=Intrasporangium calvum TaxID=53358 RepID=A0ABT5GE11_9MICO|nr:hypothetical protein [Intrasporangium calvum]MDC5696454.1 hypothetical protein [Intrasporangium calvum]